MPVPALHRDKSLFVRLFAHHLCSNKEGDRRRRRKRSRRKRSRRKRRRGFKEEKTNLKEKKIKKQQR